MLFSIQKFNEIFYNSAGQLNLLAKILLALLIIVLTQVVVSILTKSFDKLLMKKEVPSKEDKSRLPNC